MLSQVSSCNQHKCIKKQAELKEYITLLEKKIFQVQQKISGISKCSTVEASRYSIQNTIKTKFAPIFDNYTKNNLLQAFYKIKLNTIKQNNFEESSRISQIFSKNLNFLETKKLIQEFTNDKELVRDKSKSSISSLLEIESNLQSQSNELEEDRRCEDFEIKCEKKRNNFHINLVKISRENYQQNFQQNLMHIKNMLEFDNLIDDNSKSSKNKINDIYSKIYLQNCKLKNKVQLLQSEVKNMKIQIEDILRQKEKDIIKKSEGLHLLAQQLSEKNELINQYQEQLKVYRSRNSTKILAMSITDYEIEKKKLQGINSKLHSQIDNNNEHFREEKSRLESQLSKLRFLLKQTMSKCSVLSQENEQLKELRFQNDYEKENMQILKKTYLWNLQELQKSQRQYKRNLQMVNKFQNGNTNMEILKIFKFHSALHQSRILTILQKYLVSQFNLQFNKSQFYNQNTANRLNLIQNKIQQLKANIGQNNNHPVILKIPSKNLGLDQQCNDQVMIISQKNKDVKMDSICQFLQNQKYEELIQKKIIQNCVKIEQKNKQQQIDTLKSTSKIQIDFEGTKKKLEDKILQLKSRIFQIRAILFRFLKSLNISSKIPKSIKPDLLLLFEIFQYSQMQRASIFKINHTASYISRFFN